MVRNLTFMDSRSPHNVVIYTWEEYEGRKSPNEVGTCILKYIKDHVPDNIEHLIFWSDSAPGQNKNFHVPTAMFRSLQDKNNLKLIDHKFPVVGHTHLEVDSVHAAVEREVHKRRVSVTSDWLDVFRSCRLQNPYIIQQMKHTDFLDFTNKSYLKKAQSEIKISHQYWLRYEKNTTYLQMKTALSDPHFKRVELKLGNPLPTLPLTPAYANQLLVSAQKKIDQLEYIRNGAIPYAYLNMVREIPSSLSPDAEQKIVDKLKVVYTINIIDDGDKDKIKNS